MKKLFTFFILSLLLFGLNGQVTELWNYSAQNENQYSSGAYDNNGIAISPDGLYIYRTQRTAVNTVGVFNASDGSFVKHLTDLVGFNPSIGGDIAVDGNGAIYASNTLGLTSTLTVARWADASATPTMLISTTNHGGSGANRLGYGMDVYVDENGDGFLLMHKNGTADIMYWEIKNNEAVSQDPETIAIQAAITDSYARISIIDKNSFWLDGNVLRPNYCIITRGGDDYSTPTAVSATQLGWRTDMNVGVGGATEFELNGIRYGVFAANNHGNNYVNGHYALLQEMSTGVGVIGAVIANLPENGLGKVTDGIHFVEPVVHVGANTANIYVLGGFNGVAGFKAEAVEMTQLSLEAGSYEAEEKEVSLTNATPDAELYYTTNGDRPNVESAKYDGTPISIGQGTTTLKVLAIKNNLLPSLTTAEYTVAAAENTEKTYTVTVPAGTENVYLMGNFPGREWDIENPYELTATENPNEFSGTFISDENPSYKYLNGKDWDYQEAKLDNGNLIINNDNNQPYGADNRSYNENDEVKHWVASPKVKLNVSFADGINIPSNLFVKGAWDEWADAKELSKSGETFSITINQKTFANTEYKYFTNDPSDDNWENSSNRWAIYPVMTDKIEEFNTEIPDPEPSPIVLKYKKTDYAWNTGDHARSAAYYNGELFVIDKDGKKLHVLNAANGNEKSTIDNANFTGFGVTASSFGDMYVTNGEYGMSNSIKGTILSDPFKFANVGTTGTNRIDFVSAFGNFSDKAYLAGASINGSDVLAIWEIENGDFKDAANPLKIEGKLGGFATGADVAWIDETTLLVTGSNRIAKQVELDLNTPANTVATNVKGATTNAGGGAYFKINGKEFVVVGSSTGALKVFEVTDGVEDATLFAETEAIGENGNGVSHISIHASVLGDFASIYVWAPNNGLAVYEMEVKPTSIDNTTKEGDSYQVLMTQNGIRIPLTALNYVELYSINGQLLDSREVNGDYTRDLDHGVYVVRVNGKASKFIK